MIRYFCIFLTISIFAACESDPPPPNPDAEVIEQLRQAGSDLSKPHPIEFYFYFPTEGAADKACEKLASQSYSVVVRPSASTNESLCLATKSLIPTVDELNRLSSEFEALATELGGEYDGWGSPVVQ